MSIKFLQMRLPQGRKKAFTISYDDGVRQDQRLLDLMKKYGIRGTFNLNSGLLGRKEMAVIDGFETDISTFEADEIREMYQGQEIACHALTHMSLAGTPTALISWQIIEDRKNLESLTDGLVQGFAYPFGTYDDAVKSTLQACGIYYARTVNSTGIFDFPKDHLEWQPTCHHNDKNLKKLLETFCRDERLWGEPQLFYLWGHAYEFDQRDNWEMIEEAFSYVVRYKDDIWMATNGEIYDYVKAYENLQFSADGSKVYNPGLLDVWIGVDQDSIEVPGGAMITIQSKEENNHGNFSG